MQKGHGLFYTITVLFIVLKLNPGGYLDSVVTGWSWWYVLLPVWIMLGLVSFVHFFGDGEGKPE